VRKFTRHRDACLAVCDRTVGVEEGVFVKQGRVSHLATPAAPLPRRQGVVDGTFIDRVGKYIEPPPGVRQKRHERHERERRSYVFLSSALSPNFSMR